MKKTKRIKQFKKTGGQFCENIRYKWTGIICLQTGFICQRTGFICLADETSLPEDEASPPTNEASPIGSLIFFSNFSLFSNVFFLSAAGVLPTESGLKTAFSENLC